MHRNLYFVTSLVLGMLLSFVSQAEVYKTVDKNGRVTYTDVPPADTSAKPVELKSINSIPMPTPVPMESSPAAIQTPVEYRVQIVAPENGKTLMPNERSIQVSITVDQPLQSGDLFAYKIDGNTVQTTAEMTYTIAEPPRGEHTLTVDVVNSEGKSVAQSNGITLLVMRPIIKATPTPTKK